MVKRNYGVTPWGAWFVEVLDSYKMGPRLARGKTYANTGRVLSLDIEDGRAVAKVEGNYRPFYRVEIAFPPLKEKEQVFRLIEADPALLSRIASGELPEEFLEKLKAKGINLIPKRWREMKRSCNCPDNGDPCKHMAALYYIIAREIDNNPHVLFRLRGMDMAAHFGASLVRELPVPFTVQEGPERREAPPAPPELPEVPHCTELILSLLPPAPSFSDRDFVLVLGEFYHRSARWEPWPEEGDDPEHAFSRSRWTIVCPDPGPGAEPLLLEEDVLGKRSTHTVYEAFLKFRSFASDDGTESYAFLFYLFKFLNLLCAAGAFIPCVLLEEGVLRIIWKPFDSLPLINDTLDTLARYECRMLPLNPEKPPSRGKSRSPAGAAKSSFADGRGVTDLLSSALLGEWVKRNYFAYQNTGSAGSRETRNLLDLFFQGKALGVASPALRGLPLAIDRWLSVLHTDFSAWKYRFTIKPLAGAAETADFTLSMDLLLEAEGEIKRIPLKNAAQKTGSIAVLKAPTALSNYLPEIRTLSSQTRVRLSEERLVDFLDHASGLLSRLGIEVVLPKGFHRELKPRLVLQGTARQGGSLVSYLALDSLLNWEWQVAIGDTILKPDEFEALIQQKRALVRFKDGFVRLDPAELAKLLKKARDGEPTINDFLKAHFAGDSILSFDARGIVEKLFTERRFPAPKSLKASLRPYQKRGYHWICSLLLAGFGCVLADDMGLGKTVQSIAVLLRLREEGLLQDRCLIVAPAALLENWERELNRFAPSLQVIRYHGASRRLAGEAQVFLTTYQTAVRDAAQLQKHPFSLLIVDEAHLMKNAETRGARTIKQLRSQYRLALSGTPVENRLEDLRSLFDFILPGYLGTAAQFKEEYRIPIEVLRQKEKAAALRKITGPFLLRRLKTDRAIIPDLPEKISVNEYAALEKEQAALYEGIVAETMEKSETLDPKDRPSLVLALLTALKQVCDHPRVYDKESPPVSRLSGKALLLLTLLQEILANREKVLIFSQYVETLACLQSIIQNELGEGTLIYHGGLTQKERSEAIRRFQDEGAFRIFLVSLKAGGLGLNLTAASRVIHYDLWYNPAVENQATDRVFRIGQKRNVFVHRFITKNSFEEKIDIMLRDKRELADMTVSSGESWLARMSHEELKALFSR
jgi:uncharacterized Zn finger protein/superfamily II DNA or RNA helicase